MKVPTSIKLLERTVTIKWLDELIDDDGDSIYGRTFPLDNLIEISISRHRTAEAVHHTVFHELTHWVLGITGVSNLFKERVEEAVTSSVENLSMLYRLDPKDTRITWKEVEFNFGKHDED